MENNIHKANPNEYYQCMIPKEYIIVERLPQLIYDDMGYPLMKFLVDKGNGELELMWIDVIEKPKEFDPKGFDKMTEMSPSEFREGE